MLPFYAILVDVKDTTGKSRLQNSAQNDHEDVCVCVCVCVCVDTHTCIGNICKHIQQNVSNHYFWVVGDLYFLFFLM